MCQKVCSAKVGQGEPLSQAQSIAITLLTEADNLENVE